MALARAALLALVVVSPALAGCSAWSGWRIWSHSNPDDARTIAEIPTLAFDRTFEALAGDGGVGGGFVGTVPAGTTTLRFEAAPDVSIEVGTPPGGAACKVGVGLYPGHRNLSYMGRTLNVSTDGASCTFHLFLPDPVRELGSSQLDFRVGSGVEGRLEGPVRVTVTGQG